MKNDATTNSPVDVICDQSELAPKSACGGWDVRGTAEQVERSSGFRPRSVKLDAMPTAFALSRLRITQANEPRVDSTVYQVDSDRNIPSAPNGREISRRTSKQAVSIWNRHDVLPETSADYESDSMADLTLCRAPSRMRPPIP